MKNNIMEKTLFVLMLCSLFGQALDFSDMKGISNQSAYWIDINDLNDLKTGMNREVIESQIGGPVQIIESKFYELEKVCGKNCKKYERKDLRNIFKKSEGIKFDKEFKLAFKKCKL